MLPTHKKECSPYYDSPEQAKMETIERKIVAPPTFFGLKASEKPLLLRFKSYCVAMPVMTTYDKIFNPIHYIKMHLPNMSLQINTLMCKDFSRKSLFISNFIFI